MATTVCCLVQVGAAIVPSLRKRSAAAAGAESRRFCVSSRDGKLWVIEWSLRDLSCCNEVNFMDLQKQMRFKSEHMSMCAGQAAAQQARGEDTSYKLGGVATALTAPSAATASARVESVFSVLSMCSAKIVMSAATPSTKPAVFIMTTNGVLISADIEVINNLHYMSFEFISVVI